MMWLWTAIAVCLSVAIIALAYGLYLSGQLQQLQTQHRDVLASIQSLQQELAVFNTAAVGVGQRLISAEKKLNISVAKQEQLEASSIDYQPYSQAVSSAELGADIDQLVERYGLPEAEASLMARIKNAKK
jgi:hypothetical protein